MAVIKIGDKIHISDSITITPEKIILDKEEIDRQTYGKVNVCLTGNARNVGSDGTIAIKGCAVTVYAAKEINCEGSISGKVTCNQLIETEKQAV